MTAGNIHVTAVKKCEDTGKTVVRFYETEGAQGNVSLKLFERKLKTALQPFEIVTEDEDGKMLNFMEQEKDEG